MNTVLFDFDGVIIDSEWAVYQSWVKLFEQEGHPLPLDIYVQCVGSDFGTWSPESHLEELTKKSYNWKKENSKRQVQIEADLNEAEPLDGIIDLFQWIQNEGFQSFIVSSSSRKWVDGWMNKLDLMQYVQGTICREDAPRVKPAPDLYIEGVQRSRQTPADCIVLEDSLNGVKAANEAGCVSYAVPTLITGSLDFSTAHATFNSITDAAASIKQSLTK